MMMKNHDPVPMDPWYKGYTGAIEKVVGKSSYIITGTYNRLSETELEITELPIGKWTRDYKQMLEEMALKEEISEIREYHQENRVHFIVEVPKLANMNDAEILKKFKLQTSISTSNLVLFTKLGKIYRYASELDILKEFFTQRTELYEMRKEFMLAQL